MIDSRFKILRAYHHFLLRDLFLFFNGDESRNPIIEGFVLTEEGDIWIRSLFAPCKVEFDIRYNMSQFVCVLLIWENNVWSFGTFDTLLWSLFANWILLDSVINDMQISTLFVPFWLRSSEIKMVFEPSVKKHSDARSNYYKTRSTCRSFLVSDGIHSFTF